MIANLAARRAKPKRPSAWKFKELDAIRHQIIQRVGFFTRPNGNPTLTLKSNRAVREDLLHFLDALQKAA